MTDAITREEKLLAGIAIEPITREEMFLAKAGGQDVETPEPITRREKLLQGIIDNGGGGSTGGDGDTNMLNALIDGSITEITTNAESVRNNAFMGCASLTNVNLPKVTSIGTQAFQGCQKLTDVDSPQATSIGGTAFESCYVLTNVNLPKVTSMGIQAFSYCKALTTINLPLVTTISTSVFHYCEKLTSVILPKATSIGTTAFKHCKNLTTLVLGSQTLCTLSKTSAFDNTPFASGGTGGVAYVPQNLIADYEIATNWSSLNVTFLPIEGSEYE